MAKSFDKLPRVEKLKLGVNALVDQMTFAKVLKVCSSAKKALTHSAHELDVIKKLPSVKKVSQGLETVEQLENFVSQEIKGLEEIEKISNKASLTKNVIKQNVQEASCLRTVASRSDRLKCFEKIEEAFKNGGATGIKQLQVEPIELLKNGNTIKEFLSEKVKRYWEHVFSEDHKIGGILKLGATETEIMDKFIDIIINADAKNLLKIGDNTILTTIEGHKVLVRCNIKTNGILQSINGYNMKSSRLLGNVITV